MVWEGFHDEGSDEEDAKKLTARVLLLQGVATSIDALSVGFAIAEYELFAALVCAAIIMVETFLISVVGVRLGRIFGTKLAGKASILGGVILIGIGLEIFISNIFF
jgi:manganese efflux pump family protein